MDGTFNFYVSATLIGLALVVTVLGISLLRLPKGGENEPMRALGISLIFVCIMAILGLYLFHGHYFQDARGTFTRETSSHH